MGRSHTVMTFVIGETPEFEISDAAAERLRLRAIAASTGRRYVVMIEERVLKATDDLSEAIHLCHQELISERAAFIVDSQDNDLPDFITRSRARA